MREIIDEEVKVILFQMNLDKAPGPDGMTPVFFQRHWGIVGNDIIKLARQFFASGEVL